MPGLPPFLPLSPGLLPGWVPAAGLAPSTHSQLCCTCRPQRSFYWKQRPTMAQEDHGQCLQYHRLALLGTNQPLRYFLPLLLGFPSFLNSWLQGEPKARPQLYGLIRRQILLCHSDSGVAVLAVAGVTPPFQHIPWPRDWSQSGSRHDLQGLAGCHSCPPRPAPELHNRTEL